MVSVGRKNLFYEKGRLVISVTGVGFAVMLILVLAGIYDGFQNAATTYIEESRADLIVVQDGTTDMFHSFSILPSNLSDRIALVPGVASVSPLISRQVEIHVGGAHPKGTVIGFEDLGGPWRVTEGSKDVGPEETVLDRVFAANSNSKIGSFVSIGDREFKVVGISTGTNLFISQYVFLRFADASGLILPPETVTSFMVKIADGASPEDVANGIRSIVPGLAVFTNGGFARSNSKMISDAFLPILVVLYAIGGLIGMMVIGLTIYTATIERTKEYGVMKAIGASNSRLFRILLVQGQVLVAFGFLSGLALTAAAVAVMTYFAPIINFHFEPQVFPMVFAAAVAIGLLASSVPMNKIMRIDPAVVFRRG